MFLLPTGLVGQEIIRTYPLQELPTRDIWQWTPPAEHHSAIVRVRVPDGSTGSGVAITDGDLRGVLTAAHVTGQYRRATVTWPDGTSKTGDVTVDKFRHDIAFVFVSSGEGLKLADSDPPVGSRIEHCGYGGPQTGMRLRHYWGSLTEIATRYTSTGSPVFGDSGGPWLYEGSVIGIQSTGNEGNLGGSDPQFPAFPGGHATALRPIRAFLGRIKAKCEGGRCLPDQGFAGGGYYPPDRPRPQIQPTDPCQPGPRGPTGPQGPPGENADPANTAKLVLAAIRTDSDLQDLLRGPRGLKGEQGEAGQVSSSMIRQALEGMPIFRVRNYGHDGQVIDEFWMEVGDTLNLHHNERQAHAN